MKKFILVFVLLIQTTYSQQGSPYSLSIGGGVAFKQNIRDDNQYDKADKSTQIQPIPMVQLRLGPVSIAGPNIKLALPGSRFLRPYIAIKRDGERYYGPGMDWRKDSWFAEAGIHILMFKLAYSRDVQGRSHGETYDLAFNGRFIFGSFILNYTLARSFLDTEFTNYYYGVRSHEVTAERPYYSPGASGTNSFALSPILILTKNMSWFNSIKATFLDSEIKNSPTVARSWYLSIISGVTLKF